MDLRGVRSVPELVFTATGEDGGKYFLGYPLSFSWKKDAEAADELTVVFPGGGPWENLLELEGKKEGETCFQGIVDEIEYSAKEATLTLIARSRTGILLDYQVQPQTFRAPTLALLSKMFLEPLGFTAQGSGLRQEGGELTVKRGTSVLSLLRQFCQDTLGCQPVVKPGGQVICEAAYQGDTLALNGEDAEEVQILFRNYQIMSQAVFPDSETGIYTTVFQNPAPYWVPRVQYLKQGDTPVFQAEKELRVVLPYLLLGEPGDTVCFQDYRGTLSSLRLRRDQDGDSTEIRFLVQEE